MSPETLAALHASAFTTPAPWDAAAFRGLLGEPTVHLLTRPTGFLLLRVAAGEAEILTLAVDPKAQREGTGRALVNEALECARAAMAETVFLEVAADNVAARALYAACGFTEAGNRPGYYRTPAGTRLDALVLRKNL